MEITYLRSDRKRHLRNHFELRGETDHGERQWWLVFDEGDHPPELVGRASDLPGYARAELALLQEEPQVGTIRKARHIEASMCFFPDEDHNGIPHVENVAWLRQYNRPDGRYYLFCRSYLVHLPHGHEDYPTEIWEHRPARNQRDGNHLDANYVLVWKRPPEDDE